MPISRGRPRTDRRAEILAALASGDELSAAAIADRIEDRADLVRCDLYHLHQLGRVSRRRIFEARPEVTGTLHPDCFGVWIYLYRIISLPDHNVRATP